MANLLGVPIYDSSLDRENMQINAALIQQLGAQVRSDLNQIQTNRQLQGFAQGIQSINPDSRDFPQQAVGLMTQYPLAARSPIGQSAISQLGAQHKFWQEEQLKNAAPYLPVAGGYGSFDRRTGTVTGTEPGVLPSKPFQVIKDAYGNVTEAFDPNNMNLPVALEEAPIKTSEDPVELERIKQQNRLELLSRKPAGASPEVSFLKQNHSKAYSNASKWKTEAERLGGILQTMDLADPDYEKTRLRAAGAIKAAEQADAEFRDIDNRLKSLSSGIVEGIPAEPVIPVSPVNQVGAGAVAPEALIPAMPVQPTLPQIKRRRFNPSTGGLE